MHTFIIDIKANELKPKSLDDLEFRARRLIHPYIGYVRFGELNTLDVQRMINILKQEGLSYSTIEKAYKPVNQAYKYGMSVSPPIVQRNPCVGVKLPKAIERPMTDFSIFSEDEIAKICAAATSCYENGSQRYRYGYAIIVLLFTGLRFSELAGLEWKNVDLSNRRLYVRANAVSAKDRDGDGRTKTILQQSSKTKHSARVVPIGDAAADALIYLKEQNYGKYVISTQDGGLVDYWNFRHMYDSVLKRAGVENRGIHTCRHTFASMLFKRGIDAKVVSEILGHADVSITYNIYIHLIQEQKDLAISMLPTLNELGDNAS